METTFTREELIEIKRRASALGNVEGLNPSWQRTLYNLATAADHLDAMIARSTVEEQEICGTFENIENRENIDAGFDFIMIP